MKEQGFTLIELLAVIVILAIIALIATPIVLNIINNTKESAKLRSAEMYLDAVEQAISIEKMNNTSFKPNTCTITEEGNLLCDDKDLIDIKVNGEKPVNGSIAFTGGKITQVELKYKNGKAIVMNNKGDLEYNEEEVIAYISLGNYQHQLPDGTIEDHEVTFDGNGHGTCSKCMEEVLAAGLYDENDVMLASWDELVNDYGLDIEIQASTIPVNSTLSTSSIKRVLVDNECFSNGCKLIIDNSVKQIGQFQFSDAYQIKEVIIPNSVTTIGNGAFYKCSNLSSIFIPNSVTTIHSDTTTPPFIFCSSTLKIYCEVSENQPAYEDYWTMKNYIEYYEVTYGLTRAEYEALIDQ